MQTNGTTAGLEVSDDSGLARLVDELAERLRAGEAVDPEGVAAEHPEYAARLLPLLPALAVLADVSRSADQSPTGLAPPSEDDGPVSGVLGDFRVVREVGRGGMGVVYEAEQLSLGRRVALKVLPYAGALDPRHLQRFRNEARAAAGLKHDHIVSVHAVGCDRGVHFYAMEFVDGPTLAQVIAALRPQPAEPAGPDAALDHEPAPTAPVAALPTEKSGQRGREFYRAAASLVADAADALEHAHGLGIVHRDVKPGNLMLDATGRVYVGDFGLAKLGADAGLTMSGDLVGTLRYMSPEQALARHGLVDHRTDVYGLGAVLYELLTLAPAVGGTDRVEILRNVAFGEPVPPRKRHRSIPADLETVVLKCLENDPARRYATAGELAADLRRFRADEPVRARRPSIVQRLGRRLRRRPRAAAAVMVLAVGLLAGLWVADRSRAEAVTAAREAAGRAEELYARGRLDLALAEVRRARERLPGWGAGGLRGRIDELAGDLELLAALEEARLAAAAGGSRGTNSDSDWSWAVPQFEAAFRACGVDVLGGDEQGVARALGGRRGRSEVTAALAEWARKAPAEETAARLRRLAVAIDPAAESLVGAGPKDAARLRAMAREEGPRMTPGSVLLLARALDRASAREDAIQLLRDACGRHPADFWLHQDLAEWLEQRKGVGFDAVREAECLVHLTAAVALRPQSWGAATNYALSLERLGRTAEAEAALRRAVELAPGVAVTHHNLGVTLRDRGDLAGAEAAHRRAIELDPGFAVAHFGLGNLLKDRGDLVRAEAAFRRATELDPGYARAYDNLGILLEGRGDLVGAEAAHRRAIALKPGLAGAHSNLGNVLRRRGDPAGAEEAYRRAIRLNPGSASAHNNLGGVLRERRDLDGAEAAFRRAIELKPDYAEAHFNLGNVLNDRGEPAGAEAAYRRAIELKPDYGRAYSGLGRVLSDRGDLDGAEAALRRAIELDPGYAWAHTNLGAVLRERGDLDGAEAAHRRAIEIEPGFASAHFNLGKVLKERGDLTGAEATWRRAIELDPNLADAYFCLGFLLQERCLFREALPVIRRGHDLDQKRPGRRYPSAKWVREAERLIVLDDKLPAVLAGDDSPADAGERCELANLCLLYRNRPAAAVRFYTEAFAADPKLTREVDSHRYNAACAAARAATGAGQDARDLPDAERARLRGLAREWLTAELAAYSKPTGPPTAPSLVRRNLRHWQSDPDLAGVRDGAALAGLPAAERAGWRNLWSEVADLLRRIEPPGASPGPGTGSGLNQPERAPPPRVVPPRAK